MEEPVRGQMLRGLLTAGAAAVAWLAVGGAGSVLVSGCAESEPGAASLDPAELGAAKTEASPEAPAAEAEQAAASRGADSTEEAPEVALGSASPSSAEVIFPADWCARAGSDENAQFDTIFEIALGYATDQSESCATSGLTRGLPTEQFINWLNYLFGYTNAMTGCPLAFEPVEGGILEFGPANIAALGVAPAVLGRDDAAALIGQYVARFASALQLTAAERSAVEAFLWTKAQPEIDASASQMLSVCGAETPAEADSMM